jgi:formylglycine-generating enzyme required for sulfatase activity
MIAAVEMVYVPAGDFFVGSGGQETGGFTKANSTSGNTVPFLITTGPITLQGNSATSSASNLSARDGAWDLTGTNTADIPVLYPTGFSGFYCMKYEISQQQYVDFLNTLTSTQKAARYIASSTNRNGISSSSLVFSTSLPNVARNFMSWPDGAAYSDWSCLRPMTELEFEKACRGPVNPVSLEYAWGTSSVTSNKYQLTNAGLAGENITSDTYSTTEGNAAWGSTISTSPTFQAFVNGPVRVGIFAGNPLNSSRISSGASYYGIMELSGNLLELCVSLGMSSGSLSLGIGRNFTGLHGNGSLTTSGTADVPNWPANITSAGSGIIFRGGHWNNFATFMRVSDRNQAYGTNPGNFSNAGYRAVRSLPVSVAESE